MSANRARMGLTERAHAVRKYSTTLNRAALGLGSKVKFRPLSRPMLGAKEGSVPVTCTGTKSITLNVGESIVIVPNPLNPCGPVSYATFAQGFDDSALNYWNTTQATAEATMASCDNPAATGMTSGYIRPSFGDWSTLGVIEDTNPAGSGGTLANFQFSAVGMSLTVNMSAGYNDKATIQGIAANDGKPWTDPTSVSKIGLDNSILAAVAPDRVMPVQNQVLKALGFGEASTSSEQFSFTGNLPRITTIQNTNRVFAATASVNHWGQWMSTAAPASVTAGNNLTYEQGGWPLGNVLAAFLSGQPAARIACVSGTIAVDITFEAIYDVIGDGSKPTVKPLIADALASMPALPSIFSGGLSKLYSSAKSALRGAFDSAVASVAGLPKQFIRDVQANFRADDGIAAGLLHLGRIASGTVPVILTPSADDADHSATLEHRKVYIQ